jgi:protein O-mannosyl-transferase
VTDEIKPETDSAPVSVGPRNIWKEYYTKSYWVLAIFFILIAAIYGRTLFGDFVFDDREIVGHASSLSNIFHVKEVFSMPYWTEDSGLYRPVTLYSYALNYAFLGSGPIGFHLVNLILYLLTCWLLFDLLRRVLRSSKLAFLSALIFLVLAIHTEVVANIIGRAEIMALLFSLLFLIECTKKKPVSWKAGIWIFLAIGAKETAIAVIPIAFLILYFLKKEGRGAPLAAYFRPAWVSAVSVAVYFILRFFVLGPLSFLGVQTSIVENPLLFTDAATRIFTALNILTMYVSKSIFPAGLCSDYSYNQIPLITGMWNVGTLAGLVFIITTAAGIFYFINKQKALSLACAFFFFPFLPVSNILFPIGTIAGERLMFYPSVGISIFIAAVIISLLKVLENKTRALTAILIAVFAVFLLAHSFLGALRTGDWMTEKRLFTSAGSCAHNSVLSRSNMGTVYYFDRDYEMAEKEFLESADIYNGYSKGLNNLGLIYWKKGENEKAREFYIKALSVKYPYPGAYENLALLYLSEGKTDMARRWLTVMFDGDKVLVDAFVRQATTPLPPGY